MRFIQLNNIILPTKSKIGQVTVREVNDELESVYNNQSFILDGSSKILQTVLYICDNIFNSKAHFSDKRFLEFTSRESSNYYFETRNISEGVISMLSVVYLGGLIPSTNSNTTTFLYAEILDRFEPNDPLVGENGFGGLLTNCIKEILIKHYSKSGEIEVSKRLLERFKDQLKEHPFNYEPKLGTYTLDSLKYCEPNESKLTMSQVVNNLPLWYGTKAVIKTKNIKKLLIDIFCLTKEEVKFPELWYLVKLKINSWLVNSPVDINSYIGDAEDNEYSFNTPDSLKFTDNPLDNTFWILELEKEIKLVINQLDSKELTIIRNKFLGKPNSYTATQLETTERTIRRKQKDLFQKLSDLLIHLQIEYSDEFSEEDIFDSFKSEVLYSVEV